MFRKRIKKTFPPGTFIPLPARIFAILQLCMVFTILLWHASEPFMGELFAVKSKMLIFQHLMGQKDEANRNRFLALPETERADLLQTYESLQSQLNSPFKSKLKGSFKAIFLDIPPLELAWIVFSIILSIMLLKKVEGVTQVIWVLPLLALAYSVDNRMYGYPPRLTEEQKLFPTEESIIENYIHEPFSQNPFLQKDQLKKGWDNYLIQKWTSGQGTPEEGLFAFNLERAKKISLLSPKKRETQESLFLIALYVFWNISYAWIVRKTAFPEDRPQCLQSS